MGAAVAAALLGLIAGFNVILGNVLDRDARDLARARAVAQIDSIRTEGGRLSVGEAPDDRSADAYLWIFAGARTLEQPRAAPAIDRAAHELARDAGRYLDLPASDTRLYSAPVVVRGKRVGTVVAGVSLAARTSKRASSHYSPRSSWAGSSSSSSSSPHAGWSALHSGRLCA